MAYKLDLQGQKVAAEVRESSVLKKAHDYSEMEDTTESSENGQNKL